MANIDYASKIRSEPNANTMREYIADGIGQAQNTSDNAVNTANQANSTASNANNRVNNIISGQIQGKDQEIVDAHYSNVTGKTSKNLAERMDGVDSELADNTTHKLSSVLNVMYPPASSNLVAVKGDGTEESTAIQNIINYAQNNGYNTIYFPKPSVSYKCNSGLIIRIDLLNILGENSTFDFRDNTGTYCIRLQCNSIYANRYTHKHVCEGIFINPYSLSSTVQTTGLYIDGSDLESTNVAQDNFTIRRCGVFSTKYAIQFGSHAWRLRIEDCLFMWNTYHAYASDIVSDTGENIHFESCMFCDASGIISFATFLESSFSNCSFDTCFLNFSDGATAYFDRCHFENPPNTNGHITEPFLTISGNASTVIDKSSVIFNSNVCDVPPISIATSGAYSGLIIKNSLLPLDLKYYNLNSYISNSLPLTFIGGNGKIQVSNNFCALSEKIQVPFSEMLNPFDGGDFESSDGYIPIKQDTGSGGTEALSSTTPYHWGKCLEVTCTNSQSYFGYIDISCKALEFVQISLATRIKIGHGHVALTMEFLREDGSLIPTPYHFDNTSPYTTMTDTSGSWNLISTGHVCPPGAVKARIQIQLLNTPSYNSVGDTTTADFDYIVANIQ